MQNIFECTPTVLRSVATWESYAKNIKEIIMIRPLTNADEQLFMEMSREFYTSSAVCHPIPDEHHRLAFDHMMADDRYSRCYIAEQDGKAAGFMLISLTYSREAGGMAIWLEELYIRPEFRNSGLGGRFLDYIMTNYKDAKRFRLEMTHGNPAEHLYKRKGFKPFEYEQLVLDK